MLGVNIGDVGSAGCFTDCESNFFAQNQKSFLHHAALHASVPHLSAHCLQKLAESRLFVAANLHAAWAAAQSRSPCAQRIIAEALDLPASRQPCSKESEVLFLDQFALHHFLLQPCSALQEVAQLSHDARCQRAPSLLRAFSMPAQEKWLAAHWRSTSVMF